MRRHIAEKSAAVRPVRILGSHAARFASTHCVRRSPARTSQIQIFFHFFGAPLFAVCASPLPPKLWPLLPARLVATARRSGAKPPAGARNHPNPVESTDIAGAAVTTPAAELANAARSATACASSPKLVEVGGRWVEGAETTGTAATADAGRCRLTPHDAAWRRLNDPKLPTIAGGRPEPPNAPKPSKQPELLRWRRAALASSRPFRGIRAVPDQAGDFGPRRRPRPVCRRPQPRQRRPRRRRLWRPPARRRGARASLSRPPRPHVSGKAAPVAHSSAAVAAGPPAPRPGSRASWERVVLQGTSVRDARFPADARCYAETRDRIRGLQIAGPAFAQLSSGAICPKFLLPEFCLTRVYGPRHVQTLLPNSQDRTCLYLGVISINIRQYSG